MKKALLLFMLLFLSFGTEGFGSLFAKDYYGKDDNGNTYCISFDLGEVSNDAFKQFCLKNYKYYIDGFLSKEDTEDIFGSDLKCLIEKYSYIIYYSFDEEESVTLLKKTTEEDNAYYMAQGRNTIIELSN